MYGEQYEENLYWRQGEKGQLIQLTISKRSNGEKCDMKCVVVSRKLPFPPPPPTPALIFSYLTATNVNIAA